MQTFHMHTPPEKLPSPQNILMRHWCLSERCLLCNYLLLNGCQCGTPASIASQCCYVVAMQLTTCATWCSILLLVLLLLLLGIVFY